MEYMEVMDESGHHYVIPTDRHGDWIVWQAKDWEDAGPVPDYATFIDGGYLIFKEWRIGEI